jgi:hypothetical protein
MFHVSVSFQKNEFIAFIFKSNPFMIEHTCHNLHISHVLWWEFHAVRSIEVSYMSYQPPRNKNIHIITDCAELPKITAVYSLDTQLCSVVLTLSAASNTIRSGLASKGCKENKQEQVEHDVSRGEVNSLKKDGRSNAAEAHSALNNVLLARKLKSLHAVQ